MENIKEHNSKLYIPNLNYRKKTDHLIRNTKIKKKLIKNYKNSFSIQKDRNINYINNQYSNNIIKHNKTMQINLINYIKINNLDFYAIPLLKRRIKSCIQYSHMIYNNLKEDKSIIIKEESFLFYNQLNKIDSERLKQTNNYSAYYYSGSLPIKNKYIVDSILQKKSITSYSFKKNNISNRYKKINQLAKSLNLFLHNKKASSSCQSKRNLKRFFTERFLNLHNKNYLYNYYINKSNYFKNTLNITNQKSSFLGETIYTKDLEKKYSNKNEKLTFRKEKQKEKYIGEKTNQSSHIFKIKNNLKNESDYLYKKIFLYNREKKRKTSPHFVDNKLNLFYSQNEAQYNKKIKKLNEYLYKEGKKMKHSVISENAKINTSHIIKKVKFMKRIADYVYPNFVLAKVKEENKRINKNKSMDLRMPLSQLILIKKNQLQKKIDLYLGKSLNIIK